MDDINKGDRLNTLLQRHIQQVTALSTLLLQEYQALRAGHTDEIEQISLEKNRLLNELKNLEKEQQQFLSSIFSEQEKPNVTRVIASMAPQHSKTLTPLNEKLTKLAEQCHKQNQINGIVISMGQQFTDKALAILHGQNPAEVSQLIYGRNGQTETKIKHNNLTTA